MELKWTKIINNNLKSLPKKKQVVLVCGDVIRDCLDGLFLLEPVLISAYIIDYIENDDDFGTEPIWCFPGTLENSWFVPKRWCIIPSEMLEDQLAL